MENCVLSNMAPAVCCRAEDLAGGWLTDQHRDGLQHLMEIGWRKLY